MVKISGLYQGHKHCELTHLNSGSTIETDAPKDNFGKGERFSPTDLIGASLGSCAITTMAILTEHEGLKLTGSYFEVDKIMHSEPRRIGQLNLRLYLPRDLNPEQKSKLEQIARSCPVKLSLHPELTVNMSFNYCLPA